MKTSPSNFYKKVLNRASIVLNLILFILISVNLSAQEGNKKSQECTINPFGIDIIPKKMKINSTIKFKINNVNTFKVNGNTVSKPLNIDFENPSVFTGLMSGFDKVSIVPNQTSEQINQSEKNELNELYNALTRNLNEKDKIYQNQIEKNKTTDSTKMRLKSDSILILNNKIDSLIKLACNQLPRCLEQFEDESSHSHRLQ